MSACGRCQGQQIVTWSTWRGQCTDAVVSISSYPRAIPGATAIPAWAYLNVVGTDVFDPSLAQAAATQPESSVGGSSSASSTPPSSSTASASSTSPSSSASPSESAPPPDTGSSNKDIGAIVGGSVGGVVGLGLIICLGIFLMRRQSNKSMPPSAEFSKAIPPGSPVPASFDPAAVGFRSRTNSPFSNGLSSDYGHGPSMHQVSLNGATHGPAVGYAGSPWSPPPMGHTPAPSAGAFSSIYTPPPPGPGPVNAYTYTPPPGAMG
ncbi:hypothetical protein M408DRAFT_220239 [Serendipita vermifera MAFF 305830]|uniref:Uncharacterized protein n=1 Tax=Serendipita vermifera MAFF 305830 TaxID=933852 RepID=A0A0C3BM45_SERVB|nr:hypothetical protein M408DRAFT_220239 [Serendipita vermifera MAFF 305830]